MSTRSDGTRSDGTRSDGTRLAVLISGFGSNFQAILDACREGYLPDTEVVVVISNRRDAYGLERARQVGLPAIAMTLKSYLQAGKSRAEYDLALAQVLQEYRVDWVVLAGWLHVLSPVFLQYYPARVVNIHPALPGQFPGLHAIERAYAAYEQGEIQQTGVMVHLVTEGVDEGPLLAQEVVPFQPGDTLPEVESRIHAVEHRLLVDTLRRLIEAEP
ncbi:MAG: phosphoribosylglycinamide formyltransferase [Chloroflexi bacterium]|nr:phosphoribosylglycinamide formyltransferase [Chloroflexota bacterium]